LLAARGLIGTLNEEIPKNFPSQSHRTSHSVSRWVSRKAMP
jgi:hypothetical protein